MVALTVEVLGAELVRGLDVAVVGLDDAGAGRAFRGPARGLHKRNMVRCLSKNCP